MRNYNVLCMKHPDLFSDCFVREHCDKNLCRCSFTFLRQRKYHKPDLPEKDAHQLLPICYPTASHCGQKLDCRQHAHGRPLHSGRLPGLFCLLPSLQKTIWDFPQRIPLHDFRTFLSLLSLRPTGLFNRRY